MQDNTVYCSYDGFTWVWDNDLQRWLIDLKESGGPPSIHKESPKEPPFKVLSELD